MKNILSNIIRVLISAIFLISAIGKLIGPEKAALNVSELFFVPPPWAAGVAILFSLAEIAIVFLVWLRASRLLLLLPLLFAGILFYAEVRNADCGCFGSLPLFSQMPFWGHVLLLAGLFAGFYYLAYAGNRRAARLRQVSGLLSLGLIAASMISLAFGKFSAADTTVQTGAFAIVDRAAVQKAIGQEGIAIIDARSPMQFEFGHIEGAVNIPHDSEAIADSVSQLELAAKSLIVYCSGVDCDAAARLAEQLRALGCREIQIYAGGWEDWLLGESIFMP